MIDRAAATSGNKKKEENKTIIAADTKGNPRMREGKGDEEETIQSQSPTEEIEMIDYPHIQNDKQPA